MHAFVGNVSVKREQTLASLLSGLYQCYFDTIVFAIL